MDGGLLEAAIGLGGQLSRWLKPTDFLPGMVITFEMPSSGSKLFTLEILGHDEYTRKLLEDKVRGGEEEGGGRQKSVYGSFSMVFFSGFDLEGVFEVIYVYFYHNREQ